MFPSYCCRSCFHLHAATVLFRAMKQEVNLGTKQRCYIPRNQHIKCLRQSPRRWMLCFFFSCYLLWNKSFSRPDVKLGAESCLETTIPERVSPWVWIRDRWRLGVMERDRPGATGSKTNCGPDQEEETCEYWHDVTEKSFSSALIWVYSHASIFCDLMGCWRKTSTAK